jgi:peptide-methionine (R)-S-oxide reductase
MKKISKSDAEWRERPPSAAYAVTRGKATEPPFSGRYCNHEATGIYRCVCCGTLPFASDSKFVSGCGLPSCFEPIDPAHVREEPDHSCGMVRTEILCNVCDAHLGHVFDDGPPPAGRRDSINSASLAFAPIEAGAGR